LKVLTRTVQVLDTIQIQRQGQEFSNITSLVNDFAARSGTTTVLLSLCVHHTGCSLTINESADPRVLNDLATWMNAVVPCDE
jgi:thiamine phosphate synthase YjbQ (UPF0047 family)